MKKQLALLAIGCLLAGTVSAATTFTGAVDSNFTTAGNWTAGVPLDANDGTINGGLVSDFSGTYHSGTAVLNVGASASAGTLNVNSGEYSNGDAVKIGVGAGSVGLVNIANGATLKCIGSGADLFIGDLSGGYGTLTVASGGTLDTIKALEIINGQLVFAATANSVSGFKDELVVDNNGVLAFQTDGSIIATLHGNTGSYSRTAELGSTSTLDMQLGGSYSIGDSWVVMDNILTFRGVSGGDGTGVFGTVTNTLNPADVFTVDYSEGKVTVTLGSGTPYLGPEILSFTTREDIVFSNTLVTLDWVVSNATYASLDQGIGEVETIGSTNIVIVDPTTFTLTATNEFGSTERSVSIDVLAPRPPASDGPNIVFVLVDDWGWTDHSSAVMAQGHQSDFYQTPNFERLVEAGVAFTSTYAQPNCAPTRAALLSGQYSCRSGNGVYNVSSLNRASGRTTYTTPASQRTTIAGTEEIITIAEAFHNSGYVTAHFGKYHVGSSIPTNPTFPLNQGFDYNYGGGSQGNPGSYWSDGTQFNGSMNGAFDDFAANYNTAYIASNLMPYANGNDPATLENTAKHLTDATADAFTFFMNEHRSGPLANYPVYVQFHFYAVHSPTQGRPDLVAKYAGLPDGVYHDSNSYAALVEGMDHSLGRIMDYLDDPNGDGDLSDSIATNTLLVFCSDNGGQSPTVNTPLRGIKGMHYDGGIRVPCVIRMPGTIPAGKVSDTLVHVVDFYPTMLDFAGGVFPDSKTHPLDGVSLFEHVKDPDHVVRNRKPIFYHFPGYMDSRTYACSVVIKDVEGKRYKYIYAYDPYYEPGSGEAVGFDQYQLYNLTDDIGEKVNLLDYIDEENAGDPDDPSTSEEYWNYIIHKGIANELATDLNNWLDHGSPDPDAPADPTWTPVYVTYKSTFPGIDPALIGQPAGPAPATVPDVIAPKEKAFRITEVLRDEPNEKVTVSFVSEEGFVFDVQASSDLTNTTSWVTLTNAIPGQTGSTTVPDITDSQIKELKRFYRAEVQL